MQAHLSKLIYLRLLFIYLCICALENGFNAECKLKDAVNQVVVVLFSRQRTVSQLHSSRYKTITRCQENVTFCAGICFPIFQMCQNIAKTSQKQKKNTQ